MDMENFVKCYFSFSSNNNHKKILSDKKQWEKEVLRTQNHIQINQYGLWKFL